MAKDFGKGIYSFPIGSTIDTLSFPIEFETEFIVLRRTHLLKMLKGTSTKKDDRYFTPREF